MSCAFPLSEVPVLHRVYGHAHVNINFVKPTRLEMLESSVDVFLETHIPPQKVKALPDSILEAEVYFKKISGFLRSSKI